MSSRDDARTGGTAIGYVRVSSRAQDYATQHSAIERAAAARSDTVAEWYAEKRSAKTMDRPELRRLLEDIRTGVVSKLYVFKLDRLTRTGVADTFAAVSALRKAGCTLVAVADNLTVKPDSEDLTSEVLLFALGLAAKLERTAINERVAAARDRIEAEGRRWGRPSRVDRNTRERAAEMKKKGKTFREIARDLKVPRSTIARALRGAEVTIGKLSGIAR
jgi:DNA invertase Pin-like site-specific DNA recombinase